MAFSTHLPIFEYIYLKLIEFVRFISVYRQSSRVKAQDFSTKKEAIDFLGWGYEDNDLIPLGIYDAALCEAHSYQHQNEPIICSDLDLIVQAAQEYRRNYNPEKAFRVIESTNRSYIILTGMTKIFRWLRTT